MVSRYAIAGIKCHSGATFLVDEVNAGEKLRSYPSSRNLIFTYTAQAFSHWTPQYIEGKVDNTNLRLQQHSNVFDIEHMKLSFMPNNQADQQQLGLKHNNFHSESISVSLFPYRVPYTPQFLFTSQQSVLPSMLVHADHNSESTLLKQIQNRGLRSRLNDHERRIICLAAGINPRIGHQDIANMISVERRYFV